MKGDLKDLMLRNPGRWLAVAESVTCGRVQARIGAISGASAFFRGGLTAYTLEGKVRLLGVGRTHAARVDCVSRQVAVQMAKGACRRFKADYAVATTGYAEPSPSVRVRVPFAWWAVARREGRRLVAVASGRVSCRGLGRVAAQEKVAGAAYAALVGAVRARAA
jgi:nicotinamide-nucleotide amidase